MDTITIDSFFDELEKISFFGRTKPTEQQVFMAGAQREVLGFNRNAALQGAKVRATFDPKTSIVTMSEGNKIVARHRVHPGGKSPKDPAVRFEKIGSEQGQNVPDNLITKDRFKRFLGASLAGAAGAGIGYGTGRLIGKPLERKALELGMKVGPAKALRYALPTAAGLGAALGLARMNMRHELFKKVKGDDAKRNIGAEHPAG